MNDKFFDLKREKQDRIINAALKIFAKNGYQHASTDDIVKEAGISKGLLFHYFISKLGLYTFLFDYSTKYMTLEMSRMIDREEKAFFVFRKQMEAAKIQVLRSYPYMQEFIYTSIEEDSIEIVLETVEQKNNYLAYLSEISKHVSMDDFSSGVEALKVEKMVEYVVRGLTEDGTAVTAFKPDLLYKEICEYLDMIQVMCKK